MKEQNIEQLDYILVTGDAYVDHPSFGAAIIARVLEGEGYTVGIIAQPNWKSHVDIQKLGNPKYAFLVTGGNIDSMVNHYSVAKHRRKNDAYTPGDVAGKRPDRATIVYSNLIRQVYKDIPIIIGGIEASLRRMSHYDYWSDQVKRSILLDSQADLLVYGMAEKAIIEVAESLAAGIEVEHITFVKGTCYRTTDIEGVYDKMILPSYKKIKQSKEAYAQSFKIQSINTDAITAKTLIEPYSEREFIVQLPPQNILTEYEFDRIYGLPFERDYHPSYEALGGVPAIREVKFSIIANRGCFGGCNFCALTFHQGRTMQSRSADSIVSEAEKFIMNKDFKGYIHDVGGPTANFRKPSCTKQLTHGVCKEKQCLFPSKCKSLEVDHKEYLSILRRLRELPKVKKVFIRSGVRFDYVMYDKDSAFFDELCEHHVSGQLKVAPEHVAHEALACMGKPDSNIYRGFANRFEEKNKKLGKKQYLVPYLMSSHPGSDLNSAIKLAEYLRDINHQPQQVQDFYPTPATASTTMYYTGIDPRTMTPVFVPKTAKEKAMQRALIQYKHPRNYDLVKETLLLVGREDLIGSAKRCLIPLEATYRRDRPVKNSNPYNKKKPTINKKKSNYKKKTIRNVHKKKSNTSK